MFVGPHPGNLFNSIASILYNLELTFGIFGAKTFQLISKVEFFSTIIRA